MIILAGAVIVTLNSSNIIDRANTAVEQANLRHMQDVVQTLWADAYAGGATTKAEFERAVTDGLVGIDTTKYNIDVRTDGVTVTLKPTIGDTEDTTEYEYAAGLYETGAIALYETGGAEAIEDMLITSWEELLTDGTVHVENGVVYTDFDSDEWQNADASALDGDLLLPYDGSITKIGDVYWDETLNEGNGNYVGNFAFPLCVNLTGVIIPDSVTSISEEAFEECENLETVTLGEGLTSIDDYAFCYTALTNVVIPDSVTSIDEGAFEGCGGLTYITIPDSVTSIGAGAFAGCENLQSIYMPSSFLIGKDMETLYAVLGNSSENYEIIITTNGATVQLKGAETVEPNWTAILADANANPTKYKHPFQTQTEDIGIGTDGNPVDMDNWNWLEYPSDIGYGKMVLATNLGSGMNAGYIGDYTTDGQIIGKVPQYIKPADGDEFIAVDSMYKTFTNTNLVIAPEIPSTVTSMLWTFYGCYNLTTAPEIPSTVTNINKTFSFCSSLTGDLIINANPDDYYKCLENAATNTGTNLKLSGTSTLLSEILATKSTNSNVSLKTN